MPCFGMFSNGLMIKPRAAASAHGVFRLLIRWISDDTKIEEENLLLLIE